MCTSMTVSSIEMFTVCVGMVTPLASTSRGIKHLHIWVRVKWVAVRQLYISTGPPSVHTHWVIADLIGDPVICNLKKEINNML